MQKETSLFSGNSRNNYDEVAYGDKHRKLMSEWVHYIEFIPKSGSEVTVLWSRNNPDANGNSRMKVSHDYFYIYNMTQRDSGQYLWRNRDRTYLSTVTIEVFGKDPIKFHFDQILGLNVKVMEERMVYE